MKRGVVALLCAVFLAAAPNSPTVVRQDDPAMSLAATQIVLQAGLDRQTSSQNGLAALTAECIVRTPVSGVALEDAVKNAGGIVTFAVEPRRLRFYIEATTAAYQGVEALLRTALARPDFSAPTLGDARKRLNEYIARDQRSALRVGTEMLNRAFYQNSDAGLPRYGMTETLASFTSADAQAFFAAHYRRGDAVISSAGNLPSAASPVSIVDGLAPGASPAVPLSTPPAKTNSRQLIAHRDVTVPWLVAQYRAPEINSRDFGAMLILTAFIERTLSQVFDIPSIATPPAALRAVGASYDFDARPANVIVYIDGGLGDPTRTFSTALGVVSVLGHTKLSGDLGQLKNYAVGRMLEQTQTLNQRTLFAATYASHHLSTDYQRQIVKAIDATQASDLQRVASQYLDAPTIALVLPRSSSP